MKSLLTDALASTLPFVGMNDLKMDFEMITVFDCEGEVLFNSSCTVNVSGLTERVSHDGKTDGH